MYNNLNRMYRSTCTGIVFVLLLLMDSEIIILRHIDEIVEIICAIYIICNIKGKFFKEKKRLLLLFGFFLIIGLIGTLIWRGQRIIAIIEDLFFTCSKFMISYIAGYIYFSKRTRNLSKVIAFSKIVVIIMTFISIHDLLFTPWFSTVGFRFFMKSQREFFAHPTYLTHAAITLLSLFAYFRLNKNKEMLFYMLLSSWNVLVAMRTKGIAFVSAFWIMYVFFFVLRKKKKGIVYCCSIIAAILLGYNSFKAYYTVSGSFSPRRILLFDSINIMISKFPFGLGYSSFASPTAAKYYSAKYIELGYLGFQGMNPTDTYFLSDSFWPIIFGQFGFVGMLLFLMIILYFIKKGLIIWKKNNGAGFVMIAIMAYIAICSLAETSFFNPTSMLFFFLFSYIEANNREKNINYYERKA